MPKIQHVAAPAEPWPDMPLLPSQIQGGRPVARGTILTQSEDLKISSGLWSCEPGQFTWTFTWDEFVRVLEGEVTITENDGESYKLRAGDLAHFPIGMTTRWDVSKTIKKFFVIRTPEPLKL
jgi:uncharacterized cupin superfamily protein